MDIRQYQQDLSGFLNQLQTLPADELRGRGTDVLAELRALISNRKVSFSHDNQPLSSAQMDKLLSYFLPPVPITKGGLYELQVKSGIESVKQLINQYADANPGQPWPLKEFLAKAHFGLTSDRIDDDVRGVYEEVLLIQDGKRNELRDDLKALTAELNIFSKIQSQINAKLAAKAGIEIEPGLNLFDKALYGYPTEESWKASAEYKLMAGLNTYSAGKPLSIKAFLTGEPKESGAMKDGDLQNSYAFEKENNPIANFATTVGDRSRPINDQVSEKTTLLNDVSSRYNSAIEALNRFVQKYDSVMRDILNAI
ncbi:virulence-associated V antigen [Pseudomonas sp. Irchel 3E19]|uniref:virulence-associated V antigen n=1 Tax=Pseudomonas sp. Irchel 3E19 TaxID=2008981 RepID=UPI000BA31CBA|nr:virulence-associated V antigen [Pseudomonas sp. Irchel 3E19]